MARLAQLPTRQRSSPPADEKLATSPSSASHPSHHRDMEGKISSRLAAGEAFEIHELDQAGNVQRKWLHSPQSDITPLRIGREKAGQFRASLRAWRKGVLDAFLPVGFPHSVSPDYLAYQTFDSLQAFFSTISSLLASRALLQGLGVGDANSSATLALLLTILRDGTGRVATIAFAHRFGLAIEPECKRYRFLADLFNDSAFFLDLLSPFLGTGGKVLALGAGEALRALCGVAAGASKAALSSHFALFDNLAELNAKEASQETAVGLCGLLVGSVVVRWVEDRTTVFWLMVLLVLVHLWMNYLGVRCVWLRHLNRQRATIVFAEYFRTGRVLGPEETARRESIIFWRPLLRNRLGEVTARVSFSESYYHALGGGSCHENRIRVIEGDGFSLFVWAHIREPTPIQIMLWKGSTAEQAMEAWFMAMEVAWLMDPLQGMTPQLAHVFGAELASEPSGSAKTEDGADLDRDELSDYVPKWATQELGEKLRAAGWDMRTVSFETDAPIRLAMAVPGSEQAKKQQ